MTGRPLHPPEIAAKAMPATASSLPLNVHLGGEFEITGVLGEGGFAIVYLAYDHSLQRTVAIKEYMPGAIATRMADSSVIARSAKHEPTFKAGLDSFLNEARILAQFDHPALIRIHRFWEQNGTAYMAMQFCNGRTLRQMRHDEPATTGNERWLKQTFAPILDALELLHVQNCFHRDISPDNILVLNTGVPMLLDFGAARQVIGDMTQALTVILKPGFAPIEQYADDASLQQGPWTDIYGLGAVIYFALMGKPPVASVARLVKDPVPKIEGNADVKLSTAFGAAIDRSLAVYPDQRIRSIAELRDALQLPTFRPDFQADRVEMAAVQANLPALAEGDRPTPNTEVQARLQPQARAATPAAPDPASMAAQSAHANHGTPERALERVQPAAGSTEWTWISLFVVAAGAGAWFWFNGFGDQSAGVVEESVRSSATLSSDQKTPSLPMKMEAPPPTVQARAPDAGGGPSTSDESLAQAREAPTPVWGPTAKSGKVESASASELSADAQVVASKIANASASASAAAAAAQLAAIAKSGTSPSLPPAGEPFKVPLQKGANSGPALATSNAVPSLATIDPELAKAPGATREGVIATPGAAASAAAQLPRPESGQPALAATSAIGATEGKRPQPTGPGAVVRLAVRPWGNVFVDGKPRGVSPPLNELWLPEGTYTITIENGEFPRFTQRLSVSDGKNMFVGHKFGG